MINSEFQYKISWKFSLNSTCNKNKQQMDKLNSEKTFNESFTGWIKIFYLNRNRFEWKFSKILILK